MDEASKLVRELSNKLTELDHKVDLYRKDMNKEYIKYEEDLLKNVAPNVSQTVSKMIAEELENYKALYPFAENLDIDNLDSCAKIANTGTGTGTGTDVGIGIGTGNNNPSYSPSPSSDSIPNGNNTIGITSTPHENANVMTNGISKAMDSQLGFGTSASLIPNNTKRVVAAEEEERPRSPHAREKEFTGVFTPSYLPLLDSNSRYERKSNANTELKNKPKDTHMDTSSQSQSQLQSQSQSLVDASTDTRSLSASPDPRSPSIPKRKNTDEISIASNSSSDGPRRRSALRRTSTSSKNTSPRRVRFDVEGEEVLPTASPKELEPILPHSFSDDSDDEAGSEMVEDIYAPPPKRISSSQALRALSRGPLEDDGTQWTTVVAPPDGSASVDTLEDDAYTTNYFDSRPTPIPIAPRDENIPPISIPTKIPQPEPQAQAKHIEALTEEDTDVLSDDDMLDMPSLRQMRSQNKQPASILSPKKNENPEPAISPLQMKLPSKPLTLETMEPRGNGDEKSTSLTFQDDEQEDLFSFDENPSFGSRPQDEEYESDIEEPTSPSIEEDPDNVELSKSPARPIPSNFSNKKITTAPAPAHGIVGSYKGRPFSMPVVNDAVHASAASMGAMNSFVGSVNGRSGLDASDILSFRTSGGVGSFSGTPKSMSERMMMDDLMESEGESQKN
ncbi:hypothetical protein BOTCAL_0340g00160 [Botryotinia calthae]|uniref:Uncharacterized protein n=1 Tax=Botryotinia calthae TaxID=38488 RepID=A0A4Y8CTM6_9HELO|nr:hypothetical protein BOTCAL_0340g00160 [Botryotinia calthae]